MEKIYTINDKSFFSNLSLTTKLIVSNIIIYLTVLILSSIYGQQWVLDNIALTPSLILSGKSLWTFLTSMFMHGSIFHLFANMFSLYFIGKLLEKIIGKTRFFWMYLIAGLVGGIFFIVASLITGNLNTPAVGASGALFGLLGVLAILIPYSKVYLIAGPLILIIADVIQKLFLPITISETISLLITFLIFFMIFSLFSFNPKFRKIAIPIELSMWLLPIIAIVPLVIISYFIPLPIGNSAHLGGLVVGLIYGFYLKKKFPSKTNKISHMFR
jgi:membrane associated rhomboid family serine protease